MDQYVLTVGAMKCGTTTLFDLLTQHPEISASRKKEVGFFAFDTHWARGFEWYHSFFEFDPAKHQYRMEASTDYTKHPFVSGVAKRLTEIPDKKFKLIYIIRHPLRRIESHARHTQHHKREIGALLSDRPDHSLATGVSPVSLAITNYAQQLDEYRMQFENGTLLITTLEELKTDQTKVLERIWDFLGLKSYDLGQPDKASNVAVEKRRLPHWFKSIGSNHRFVTVLKLALPKAIRQKVKQLFMQPVRIKGRFDLKPEEEETLLKILTPEMERVRDVYGVDVISDWKMD